MNLRTKCTMRVIENPFRDLRRPSFKTFDAYCMARQREWRKKLTLLQRIALSIQRFGFWI